MRSIKRGIIILPTPEKCDTSELEKIWEYTLPKYVREGRTNILCAVCTKIDMHICALYH